MNITTEANETQLEDVKTTKHKMIEVESNILDSIIWLSTVYSVRITAVHASSPVVY